MCCHENLAVSLLLELISDLSSSLKPFTTLECLEKKQLE